MDYDRENELLSSSHQVAERSGAPTLPPREGGEAELGREQIPPPPQMFFSLFEMRLTLCGVGRYCNRGIG